MANEPLSLVQIREILKDRHGIDISDRSLARYRDDFMDTLRDWIHGKGKRRRYDPRCIDVFKMVADLKAQGENRQAIQSALDKEFGVIIDTSTGESTENRQETGDGQQALVVPEDIRKFVLSIPDIIDRQEEIIEQQAELIEKMEHRITRLEQPFWRRWFKRKREVE